MSDTIFNNNEVLEGSANLLSFKDCPNRCIDGYYVDPYQHKRIKCKYCEQKRIEIARNKIDAIDENTNKNIEKILHLPKYYNGINYNKDSLIDKGMIKSLDEEKIDEFHAELDDLMNNASIGEFPDYSILINLGMKAYHINFIYPYMLRLYMNGVTLCPLLTAYDIYMSRNNDEYCINEFGITFNDLLKNEGCIVLIDAGSDDRDVDSVKGLMELRALRNKATVIITGVWSKRLKRLQSEDDEIKVKNLAHVISIPYKKDELTFNNSNKGKVEKKSINGLNSNEISSDMMKNLMSSRNNI